MPEIQMPKLSDTMTEGTLVAWKKKKGDKVSAGEVLAEIESDKATMEWESPEDGTLTEIYIDEGGKVNVGDKIAFIGGEAHGAGTACMPQLVRLWQSAGTGKDRSIKRTENPCFSCFPTCRKQIGVMAKIQAAGAR